MKTTYWKLAWRNVWRNRRRSVITIAAIAFAILMVAITRSLQYGTYDTMESMAVSLYNGELQIHRRGFQKDQTLTNFMAMDELDWQALLRQHPALTGFSRRLRGFGLVSSDSSSAGALIVGIEPEREARLTLFSKMVGTGERLVPQDDHQVLIGATLAKNLQVEVGDSVVVLAQGYRNQLGADVYRIQGFVNAGQAELDRGLMIMPLHNAQDLYSLPEGITEVVFRTTDLRKAGAVSGQIAESLDAELYEVLSWEELMPELQQIIIVDNASGAIYLAFILLVVGIEIFNATMMSILERTREFGVMQAVGMKPVQISALLFLESMLKVGVALVLGLAISLIVISYLTQTAIPLPPDLQEAYASYGFVVEDIKFSGRSRVYFEPLISVAIIGVVAFIFPFIKAARLSPVAAFRKV